ncbi:MAG: prepilin-type N-terminal cleavage/methylation domain-containing protein [Gemmatimonadaceae bacterium]|nr:prepilin-type N-terminal cleavage/methylation domain-containing protein [Gemmatimonadaceae bacterium]
MRPATSPRRGLSLLEVMVALTILGTALLGMAEYGRKFASTNQKTSLQNTALDIATERIERIKAERNYTTMDTLAGSHAITVSGVVFVRQTLIVRTQTPALDFKTITVSVNRATMAKPIRKTSAIARF